MFVSPLKRCPTYRENGSAVSAHSPVKRGQLSDELVSRAVDGEDVLWLVRRFLDLLPQLRHEVVDRSRRRRLFVAPHLIENLLARDDLTGVREQIAQQIELAGGEIDAVAAPMRLVRAEIDLDVADAAGLEARRPAAGAAQHGAHAREELRDAERLGDVVVGAELEAEHFLGLL